MSERNIPLLLNDIVDAIGNILDFTKGYSFEKYTSDLKTRHAVERNFEIMGEAISQIPNSFKEKNPVLNGAL